MSTETSSMFHKLLIDLHMFYDASCLLLSWITGSWIYLLNNGCIGDGLSAIWTELTAVIRLNDCQNTAFQGAIARCPKQLFQFKC